MKKHIKRLKKHIHKAKEYLKDQAFYAKELAKKCLRFALTTGVEAVKLTALGVLIIVACLSSEIAHRKFLEAKVGSNVLFIRSLPDAELQGSATGFEMHAKSGKVYTVTNAHVCGLRNKDNLIGVQDKANSGRILPKRVIEIYPENDLCIVEGLEGYSGLTLGDAPEVGQTVVAIGYPLGQSLNISKGRIKDFSPIELIDEDVRTPEQCTGPRHHLREENLLFFTIQVCTKELDSVQTDMSIFPGNSGSPMVNVYGNVVGVVFASNNRTNWGSAVPQKDLIKLLESY